MRSLSRSAARQLSPLDWVLSLVQFGWSYCLPSLSYSIAVSRKYKIGAQVLTASTPSKNNIDDLSPSSRNGRTTDELGLGLTKFNEKGSLHTLHAPRLPWRNCDAAYGSSVRLPNDNCRFPGSVLARMDSDARLATDSDDGRQRMASIILGKIRHSLRPVVERTPRVHLLLPVWIYLGSSNVLQSLLVVDCRIARV